LPPCFFITFAPSFSSPHAPTHLPLPPQFFFFIRISSPTPPFFSLEQASPPSIPPSSPNHKVQQPTCSYRRDCPAGSSLTYLQFICSRPLNKKKLYFAQTPTTSLPCSESAFIIPNQPPPLVSRLNQCSSLNSSSNNNSNSNRKRRHLHPTHPQEHSLGNSCHPETLCQEQTGQGFQRYPTE
jgi:hypothetical protein